MGRRRKKKEEDKTAGSSSSEADDGDKGEEDKKEEKKTDGKGSIGIIRMQKDHADLDLPENVKLVFPKKGDIMNFSFVVDISYEDSYWSGGKFEFQFQVPSMYPFDGPKVLCIDKIYHPNIDLEGKVCVSILRPWKPTYSIQDVLFGILFLFTHPNPNDPLNHDAAKTMRENKDLFIANVRKAMRGGLVDGVKFPKNSGSKV